jgi:hypothetical protein
MIYQRPSYIQKHDLFRAINGTIDNQLENWENRWQMSFNPSKCTVIRVAPNKSKTVIHTNYQLHGHTLEIVDSSKYLGVTLTSKLSWDKHVDNVAAKGNRTLGFIRRNLKDYTRTAKETSYTAIVRPTIEYAATVWDPTSQSKIKALENIQRRGAPGCVTNMITSLG